jgi:hypothetical protein
VQAYPSFLYPRFPLSGFYGKSSGEGFEEKTTPPGIPAVVLLFLSV